MKEEDRAIAIINLTRLASAMLAALIISMSAFLSGCTNENIEITGVIADYSDAMWAEVDAWEELIGDVSSVCLKKLRKTIVTEVDPQRESLDVPCGFDNTPNEQRLTGCFVHSKYGDLPYVILILSTRTQMQKMDTAVHEFVHATAQCMESDSDGDHSDKRLWDRYGTDTVEAVGCANLSL